MPKLAVFIICNEHIATRRSMIIMGPQKWVKENRICDKKKNSLGVNQIPKTNFLTKVIVIYLEIPTRHNNEKAITIFKLEIPCFNFIYFCILFSYKLVHKMHCELCLLHNFHPILYQIIELGKQRELSAKRSKSTEDMKPCWCPQDQLSSTL